MSLVLDGNHLYDEGIIEIGHALKDRFQSIENFQEREGNSVLFLPLDNISLQNTLITDQGFKFLLQRIESIYSNTRKRFKSIH